MKVSFCITACHKDIDCLDNCLSYINKQTVPPDEIILLASNIKHWNNSIKVSSIFYTELLSAGNARN